MFIGDFNAHLGNLAGGTPHMQCNRGRDANGVAWYLNQRYTKCEKPIDLRGRALNRLCASEQLIVLNGRA